MQGLVFNIIDDYTFQIWLAGSYDAAVIETRETLSGIYKNNFVKVYGTVAGVYEGTNAYGASITQPLIQDAFFVKTG